MSQFQNLNKILEKIISIVFIILIGLIFYAFYRSEILYEGLYRDHYLKYYIFLISTLLVLLLINFLNKEIKLIFYTILFSLLLGCYISEILLFDFKSLKSKTKLQHYLDLKKNQEIVVATYPFKYILKDVNQKEIFPLSGISNKLTIYCKKYKNNKDFVIYKSDRYGFRNEDEKWDKKIDFVLVGDSSVQGSCVPSKKTINSQIAEKSINKLNKNIDTINLGFSGSGPLLYYATLKEYLKKIDSQKVLLFFTEGNDLYNLHLELKDPFLKKYLNYEFQQNLINKQPAIDKVNYNLIEAELNKVNENIYSFIKLEKLRSVMGGYINRKMKKPVFKPTEKIYGNLNKVLLNIKKLTEEKNAELYFIYMPHFSRFTSYNFDTNYEIHSKTISMVKNLDIKYIDMLKKFRKHNDPLSMYTLRTNQHMNENGYMFVAQNIIKELN